MSDKILVGVDSGNTSNKVSYLDTEGNIQSFEVPTVVAKAPSNVVNMSGGEGMQTGVSAEKMLHLRIDSDALSTEEKYWYVGEYAISKEGIKETTNEPKNNNKYHTITTLSALAVIAVNNGGNEIDIVYSGGLPINEYKETSEQLRLGNLKGRHTVQFLDGAYANQEVSINIVEGYMSPEGVVSHVGLRYVVENNELYETEISDTIGKEFAIIDLGSGTTDVALFKEFGLDKDSSHNTNLGTNTYIDKMIVDINALEVFEGTPPFSARSEFVEEVIEPSIERMIKNGEPPIFEIVHTIDEKEDVSNIVFKYMEEYFEEVKKFIGTFMKKHRKNKKYVLVGGGLLFAYPYFRELEDKFIFPPNILEAPFFTSRSYLISNFFAQSKKNNEEQPV